MESKIMRLKLTSKSTATTLFYTVTYGNEGFDSITVTNDPYEVISQLSRIEHTRKEEVLGLEVQYCRHESSTSSKKPAAILTLCGLDACLCLIIQLPSLRKPIPDQLRNLFSNKRCKFVGANMGRSVAMLKQEYGINIDRYEDISYIAVGRSLEKFLDPAYRRKVAYLMMKLRLMRKTTPEIQGAVWEKAELDDVLVAYAALEAYCSYMIGVGRIKGK